MSGCGWRFERSRGPQDNIHEILQAIALFAGILKTALEAVGEVERIRGEHKASEEDARRGLKPGRQPGFMMSYTGAGRLLQAYRALLVHRYFTHWHHLTATSNMHSCIQFSQLSSFAHQFKSIGARPECTLTAQRNLHLFSL